MLYTYRRKSKKVEDGGDEDGEAGAAKSGRNREVERRWSESWLKKIPAELSGSKSADDAQSWLRANGFRNVVREKISVKVMQRIHPKADEQSLQRDGIEHYVYGILPADFAGAELSTGKRSAIAVYCLYDAKGKMAALQVDPCQVASSELGESRE